MRIALLAQEVTPQYTGGGIGTYTTYLAAGLRDLGHEVEVVGRTRPVTLPGRRRYPTLANRLEAAIEARRAVKALGRFDVIEGPDWLAEAAFLPRSAARVHARHVHGGHRTLREWMGWLPSREQKLAEAFEARDLERADVVTVASRLSTLLPSGASVVRGEPPLVPMPVPPMPVSHPPAERVVTLMGRVERRKGPEVLLDAAALVGDVTVRFVGADSRTDAGESYAETLRRRAKVPAEFPGPRTDVGAALAEARVVAVPSRYEPFSMVAIEALACGRPVVLSDKCGAAEVLDEDNGAFVFPDGDAEALAALLARLLDDPSPGANGPVHVRTHHSLRAAAQAKLDVWTSM